MKNNCKTPSILVLLLLLAGPCPTFSINWQGPHGIHVADAILETAIANDRSEPSPHDSTNKLIMKDDGFAPKVQKAWEKADALVGWLAHDGQGDWLYLKEKPKNVASLPVFLLQEFKPGVIVKLPKPSIPFAIGLGSSGITDQGVKELAGLQNLQALDLSHTKVTDLGLKELAVLEQLRILDLGATVITDIGVKYLTAIKGLQKLYLGSTIVSDQGLKELGSINDLRSLYLYNTKITDAGLNELVNLKYLQTLILSSTDVSDYGVDQLIRVLPNLRVLR